MNFLSNNHLSNMPAGFSSILVKRNEILKMQRANLSNMPVEVVTEIIKYLTKEDLYSLRLTNGRVSEVAKNKIIETSNMRGQNFREILNTRGQNFREIQRLNTSNRKKAILNKKIKRAFAIATSPITVPALLVLTIAGIGITIGLNVITCPIRLCDAPRSTVSCEIVAIECVTKPTNVLGKLINVMKDG